MLLTVVRDAAPLEIAGAGVDLVSREWTNLMSAPWGKHDTASKAAKAQALVKYWGQALNFWANPPKGSNRRSDIELADYCLMQANTVAHNHGIPHRTEGCHLCKSPS